LFKKDSLGDLAKRFLNDFLKAEKELVKDFPFRQKRKRADCLFS